MSEVQEEQPQGDVEAKASRQGWTPQEEFKGDPDKWVDARSEERRVGKECRWKSRTQPHTHHR